MSCRAVLVLALLLLAAPATPYLTDEDGGATACFAILLSRQGEVVAVRGEEQRSARAGFVLLEGDVVVVSMGGQCTVLTASGEIFTLRGPAEYRVERSSEGHLLDAVVAWISLQFASWAGREADRSVIARTGVRDWRTEVCVPPQILPAPGGRVRGADAALVWGAAAGIRTYRLTVVSSRDEETEYVVEGPRVEAAALSEGEEYVWCVEPCLEGWPADAMWRSFRVMTAAEEVLLARALEGQGDLASGVILLCAGLVPEAIARFDDAAKRSADADVARRWRAQALAEIGLYAEAYESLRPPHLPRASPPDTVRSTR
jgi:hypothetical protein